MRLALWNTPPAEFLVSGLTAGGIEVPLEIERHTPAACLQRLRTGQVDAAMVTPLDVLKDVQAFDVLPAVALSSWSYPYARLVVRTALGEPLKRVVYDPRYELERVVAGMVLKEHYGALPAFEKKEGATAEALLSMDADAALVVGEDVPLLRTERTALDLGQEWYELANYPMVWGLFAVRKGEARKSLIRALREIVEETDLQRPIWVRAQESPAALHDFYHEGVRLRFDDLAVASLTEFKHYLFYHDVLDDVPNLPVVFLPENDEEEGRTPLL